MTIIEYIAVGLMTLIDCAFFISIIILSPIWFPLFLIGYLKTKLIGSVTFLDNSKNNYYD